MGRALMNTTCTLAFPENASSQREALKGYPLDFG
jgi:hypothetical protein